ncbi:ankyrin repeat-containing domain protein [Aspergillus californicus]
MPLLNLPNELLVSVATHLEYSWDISAFTLVDHDLYTIVKPYLYKFEAQYTQETTFLWAAANNDEYLIQKLVGEFVKDGRVDLLIEAMALAATYGHTKKNRSSTALEFAVDRGHHSVVKSILKHSHRTQFQKSIEIVDLLFSAVLVVNGDDDQECGTAGIVQYLLESGIDPNVRDGGVYTPIVWAAKQGHLETARCLLAHGAYATPQVPDKPNFWCLTQAVVLGHIDVAELLLGSADQEELLKHETDLGSLLAVAAACGSGSLVQRLLLEGKFSSDVEGNRGYYKHEALHLIKFEQPM